MLVVVYTRDGKYLLMRRVDHPEFWQSVTGSLTWEETDPRDTALRELAEETGISNPDGLRALDLSNQYEIYPEWRHRYAPGITHNIEHAFALELPHPVAIRVLGLLVDVRAQQPNVTWLFADLTDDWYQSSGSCC